MDKHGNTSVQKEGLSEYLANAVQSAGDGMVSGAQHGLVKVGQAVAGGAMLLGSLIPFVGGIITESAQAVSSAISIGDKNPQSGSLLSSVSQASDVSQASAQLDFAALLGGQRFTRLASASSHVDVGQVGTMAMPNFVAPPVRSAETGFSRSAA